MKIFLSFIIVAAVFIVLLLVNLPSGDEISQKDELKFQVVRDTAKQFEKQYGLKFMGIGGSGDENVIKQIMLSFTLDHIVSKDNGRKLIIKCIKEFLHNINEFEEIRPFLVQYPFTVENIELTIFFYKDKKYDRPVDPDICCISLGERKTGMVISYRTNDPQTPYGYKSVEREPYEEALKIVQQDNRE